MKNLYFTLVFISLITSAQAQKISFTDTSNIWRYRYSDVATIIGYDFHFADTIITIDTLDYMLLQAKQIYRLNTTQGNGDIFFKILIREDTITKKVYTRVYNGPNSPKIDSNEQILFDYTLKKGDTVTQLSTTNDTFVHHLSNIDSIQINGKVHKVFYFNGISLHATDYVVIEGVGCLKGVIFPLYPTQFETDFPLYCFTNSGIRPTINKPVHGFDNNASCYTSINDYKFTYNSIKTYPQPATSVVNIQLPATIQSGSVTVYNQLGQIVINNTIANKELLEINNPGNLHGLYYYRVTDNIENKVYSGKLLFE